MEEEQGSNGGSDILRLPEELLKQVIIRTSPLDTCRCSLTSYFICHVAESDAVWEHFLPPDLPSILDHRVEHSSLKDLYLRLSDSSKKLSIDNGRTIFGLERSTGAKCYILSSRSLKIEHGNKPEHWIWICHPVSRFNEVAELLVVYWFDIRGSIESTKLSPNTKYAAYLLFKLTTNSKGLNTNMEALITIRKGGSKSRKTSLVQLTKNNKTEIMRKDGWMETEIGEFYNEEGVDTCVKFRLREINTKNKKAGLLVEGVEIRPKI